MTGLTPTRFGAKLDELGGTIELVLEHDCAGLARAIRGSLGRPAIAVGSGGSAVTAAYFARCRETLGGAVTQVMTPMEFALGPGDLECADVWLFSAGADNADFRAALESAGTRRAARIVVVTRRADAAETLAGETGDPAVFAVPVASVKDGFLATHSLVSSVVGLLLSSNMASSDPVENLAEAFRSAARLQLDAEHRHRAADLFSSLTPGDTLLIVADPQLASIAKLLETSAWEASLCPVQLTDFRNFAHGRHTWLHHHPERTIVLALAGHDSAELWANMARHLPSSVREIGADFGNCGRFANALGLLQGLVWIEAMGSAAGIDPGKPGFADFGRALYSDGALLHLAQGLEPALRQKRAAQLERDDPAASPLGIHTVHRDRAVRLSEASIGGIVFDYDGTIVSTDRREEPPATELIAELTRLHRLGVRLAIASGRGGSAGERLREVFPPEMHSDVLMGYYNGGYIRSLDIDIREEPPRESPEIVETAAWLARRSDLFSKPFEGERCRVQVSIQVDHIADLERFHRELATCAPIASGAVRMTRSGHSVDLIPANSSKTNVAAQVAQDLAGDIVVLRIGDQGSRHGNDNELLSHPFGISVKDVCGREDGCWSLFGAALTGPDALLRLLTALKRDRPGCVRVDREALGWTLRPNEYK